MSKSNRYDDDYEENSKLSRQREREFNRQLKQSLLDKDNKFVVDEMKNLDRKINGKHRS